jgi:hypothetical protein
VSTFYVLPPRPYLGRCFAGYLGQVFPGLGWEDASWTSLADALTAAATGRADVYVVHREDLPAGEDTARALIDGFGAEPGDEVVEVRAAAGGLAAQRWRVR